ncbi:hypothetical protein ACJIZ3_019484 [Penstemon smallii]|uniref:DUF7903 domain-containing protein n=1 Tax=Penstemon smallii TaxID=265156 RepID=A0ABD3T1F4_9LAMI
MAYVPPHKRHLKSDATSSSSSSITPARKLNHKSKTINYVYAENAKWRWLIVGLANESRIPDLTLLHPVSMEFFQQNSGENPPPLTLMLKEIGAKNDYMENPWLYVAKTLKQDLLFSFQEVNKLMKGFEFGEIKPSLVARFGKILFHGDRSISLESINGSSLPLDTMKRLSRSFYTNIPPSYIERITSEFIPKVDFKFEEEKQLYNLKISDKMRPDISIACKCTVAKGTNKLELYKIGLNQVRHLVADMSCLGKNLDLRLMLFTKKVSVALTDEELEDMKSMIESAVLDSEVEGGVRWPLGKQSSGDRYTVIGVRYMKAQTYRNSVMKLNVRCADRFDYRSSHRDVAEEVSLTMPGIISQLREQNVNTDLALEMLKKNMELIWKNF